MGMQGVTNKIGGIVRGKDFFGREKFVDLVWQKLLHGNILLAAPRRFGKTSVMYRLIDEPRFDSKVVHTDIEAVKEPADFIMLLVESLARVEGFENTVGKIGFLKSGWNFFRTNFEEIELFKFKVKLRDEIREDWQTRGKEIFQTVAKLDSIVIFILDEFPMMLDAMVREGNKEDVKTLLHWFRSIRQSPEIQGNIRFVIAGSIGIDHILNELGESASINDFEKLRLEPFSAKVAKSLIDELSATGKLELTDEIKAKMLELIGTPIPYFIQILFSKISESNIQEEREITIEIVDKIYRDKVLGVDCKTYFEHYYGRLHAYYEPNEEKAAKKLLRDIALSGSLKRETCFQVFRKNIGEKAAMERFSGLMTELENDFYITFNTEMGGYEFGSTLLRDWWLRHYGLTL